MKDTHAIQMLSAEVALKGRSVPIYREIFEEGELKNRASKCLEALSSCIPAGKEVLIIMDAGFGEDWVDAIAKKRWYWLVRARGKKFIKLSDSNDWVDAREFYDMSTPRAKQYPNAYITKQSPRACRVVIKSLSNTCSKRKKTTALLKNYHAASGNYKRAAKEPWVLVTHLPENYSPTQIVNTYKKRMQIEESFRDVKSHQFGLSARYIRTVSIYRWAIAMLLAAIVQVTLWIIGVIAHHQGMQSYFQANTVRDKKVFSYFFLGQLIVEHHKLDEIMNRCSNREYAMQLELKRDW